MVCAGIHMSDIPAFPYRLLWEERVVRSVANLTRQDGRDFLAVAERIPIHTRVETYRPAAGERRAGRPARWPPGRRGRARAMTPQEQQVAQHLTSLGIQFERYEHPPIATAEEGEVHWSGIDAVHCKNLFLRNQKGTRHYLVILSVTKRADLRAVAEQIGEGETELRLA